jgi:hypothetical protein
VGYAADHPVYCARREDLGCQASHPGSRWDSMKADKAGWFHSRAEECAWCPEHVPDWVPAWRARQAARLYKVRGSFARLPAVLKCTGCKLEATEESEDPDLLRALRDAAFEHGKQTGHRVIVTTAQELAVVPVDGPAGEAGRQLSA